MKKLLTTSLVIAGLSSATHAASFDDAIKNANTSGQFRFGYISVAPDASGSPTTTGAAIGGEIKFETKEWNRLQFAVAPYFSEKIDSLTGDTAAEINGDYFDSNNDSFAYLGEAYVNYAFSNGSVRYGRQKLDNPFINTDDIRMFSNTFNALWLNMNLNKSLTLEAGQVSTWAGFDSATATSGQDKFKRASNDGVSALGLNYKQSDALSAQAWYYNFDKKYSLLYADATYAMGDLELGVQMGSYSETNASGTDGTVLGASVTYSTGSLTLSAAINSASNDDGKSSDLGLGGGNYYAAMDEMTIDTNDMNDAQAHVISVEYAVIDNFSASIAQGHFEDSTKATKVDETDLVLSYDMSDKLNFEFIHTMVDNKGTPADTATNFSRQTARITYSF